MRPAAVAAVAVVVGCGHRPSTRSAAQAQTTKGEVSTAKIFISYRREDSAGHAGRLYDRLSARFGEESVFMDVLLPPGEDFVKSIEDAVGSCDVLIALIGERWLDARGAEGGRRLDDPGDFVRLELESALNAGVHVMPALVRQAAMPTTGELPGVLEGLSRRQAVELSDSRWQYDVDRLVDAIERVTGVEAGAGDGTAGAGGASQLGSRLRQAPVGRVVLVLALVVVAVGAWGFFGVGTGAPPKPAEIVREVGRGTVRVQASLAGEAISGTGLVVDADKGLVLTNSHVASGASSLRVSRARTQIDAGLMANAPCDDLALLKLATVPGDLAAPPIGDSDELEQGDPVTALGYPGSGAGERENEGLAVERGSVVERHIGFEIDPSLPTYPSVLEHSAELRPGDSGGPLVDAAGEVVGLNTLALEGSRELEKFYAIAGRRLREVLPDLTAGRSDRSLGWSLVAGTQETIEKSLDVDISPYEAGLAVLDTVPGSPADRAGFKRSDVILEVGREPVQSIGDLCRVLDSTPADTALPVVAASKRRPNGFKLDLERAATEP